MEAKIYCEPVGSKFNLECPLPLHLLEENCQELYNRRHSVRNVLVYIPVSIRYVMCRPYIVVDMQHIIIMSFTTEVVPWKFKRARYYKNQNKALFNPVYIQSDFALFRRYCNISKYAHVWKHLGLLHRKF